jgi:hypothetical protein
LKGTSAPPPAVAGHGPSSTVRTNDSGIEGAHTDPNSVKIIV